MRADRVREGETPERFSARVGAPLCALMRRNRVLCPAWLYPGRVALVPEPGFCARDAFPCPAALVNVPARETRHSAFTVCEGDSVLSLSLSLGTPERLVRLALGRRVGEPMEGERFLMEDAALDATVITVLPGETLASFAKRTDADAAELARLNRLHEGRVFPGMRLALPKRR